MTEVPIEIQVAVRLVAEIAPGCGHSKSMKVSNRAVKAKIVL